MTEASTISEPVQNVIPDSESDLHAHEAEVTVPVAAEKPAKSPRLRSLDAFRGLTIALMLLVNNIALDSATPKHLLHADWNAGVHLADLVFPWFLFAVGVAIPFSAASAKSKGMPAWRYDVKIVLRCLSLIALGCLVDSAVLHTPIFTLGVLQIIGLAFLVGALLYDLPLGRRMIIALGLLLAYWASLKFIPVPGAGTGIFEESRNLILYLNQQHFNAVHLWGITSMIPTGALVLIGTIIGDLLRKREWPEARKLSALFLAGVLLVGGGVLWNISLPYNKSYWTPSYILLAAGFGAIVLTMLYLVMDAAGWWKWSYPLLVFGSNAILAYVLPILVKLFILENWMKGVGHGVKMTLEQWMLTSAKSHFGPIHGGWLYTIGYIVVWWAILWIFYRKRIFLRV